MDSAMQCSTVGSEEPPPPHPHRSNRSMRRHRATRSLYSCSRHRRRRRRPASPARRCATKAANTVTLPTATTTRRRRMPVLAALPPFLIVLCVAAVVQLPSGCSGLASRSSSFGTRRRMATYHCTSFQQQHQLYPTCTPNAVRRRAATGGRLFVVNPLRKLREAEVVDSDEQLCGGSSSSSSSKRSTRRNALVSIDSRRSSGLGTSSDIVDGSSGVDYLQPLISPFQDDESSASPAAAGTSSLRQQQKVAEAATQQQREEEGQFQKYVMFGLLWFIACLSALDRVAMSVALVPMSAEYDMTDSIKGSISSLFSVGYGVMILPAGLLVGSLPPRTVMAVGLAAWSLATIATPLAFLGASATSLDGGHVGVGATAMAVLLAARATVGAGESVILPTIQRLLSAWTSPSEKSTSLAAVYTGFQAGTIAAYLLSPVVMDTFDGWRGLFFCYGAVGLAILVPWMLFAKDRPPTVADGDVQQQQKGGMALYRSSRPWAAAASATATAETPSFEESWESALKTVRDAPWMGFLQSKGTWACLLAHCAKNWGLYIALAWTPSFYFEEYGIGVRDSAWLSVLPSIAGAVCGLVAGTSADAVLRNLDNVTDDVKCTVRKGFQSFAFLGQGLALGALAYHIPEDPVVAQTFLMAGFGLMGFNAAGFEAGIQDKAGERWAGLMYSFTTLPAVLAGTFGVYITGRILDLTGQDWGVVFGLNAAVNVLGALAFLALYDSQREFD